MNSTAGHEPEKGTARTVVTGMTNDPALPLATRKVAECRHCGRSIALVDGRWIDPEATGDDSVWRETCDEHDTFTAEHEPKED